jgi:hypothetical protein
VARTVFLDEPPYDIAAWLERRRALGQDLYYEVWEGEYHVAPILHSRHGFVVAQVAERLGPRARRVGLWPVGAVNIGLSEHDFRVPDYAAVRGRDNDL